MSLNRCPCRGPKQSSTCSIQALDKSQHKPHESGWLYFDVLPSNFFPSTVLSVSNHPAYSQMIFYFSNFLFFQLFHFFVHVILRPPCLPWVTHSASNEYRHSDRDDLPLSGKISAMSVGPNAGTSLHGLAQGQRIFGLMGDVRGPVNPTTTPEY